MLKEMVAGGTQTSGASPVDSIRFTPQEDATYRVKMSVLGQQLGGTNVAYYERDAIVRRDVGQAPTVVLSNPNPIVAETVAGWDATVVIVGNDLVVRLTGAAGQTVVWTATLDGFQVGPF